MNTSHLYASSERMPSPVALSRRSAPGRPRGSLPGYSRYGLLRFCSWPTSGKCVNRNRSCSEVWPGRCRYSSRQSALRETRKFYRVPSRHSPCSCGSHKRFKNCCGKHVYSPKRMRRTTPKSREECWLEFGTIISNRLRIRRLVTHGSPTPKGKTV